jgi:peptidoglycan/xylan/chitin deacetylase (PgdA/CDA1 family)
MGLRRVGLRGRALVVWVLVGGWSLGLAMSAGAQQIAITFDDLPAHGPLPAGETRIEVANKVIRALDRAHVPPTYGFVNGVRVEEEPDSAGVLGAWREAGFPLGNHTWSHMNLNQHSLREFEQDTEKNEGLLESQMRSVDWHWFRFPYLADGDNMEKQMGVRVFFAEHGYRIAAVTMSFADYEWNEPYARCEAKHDRKAIAGLERSYLLAADEDIGYRREISEKLFGRDIPYVLLMHIGAFDARMLPRLLRLYQSRGFTFVTLGAAEEDSFYKYDVDPKLLSGPDTLEGAMAEKHLALPGRKDYGAELEKACR